jgi:hypothetical protein
MNSKQKQTIIKLLKSNRDNKDYSERYWFPYDTFLDVTDAFTAFSCERLDGKQDYIAMINRLQNADDSAKAFVEVYGFEENDNDLFIYADTIIVFSKLTMHRIEQIFNEDKVNFPSDIGILTDNLNNCKIIDGNGSIIGISKIPFDYNAYYCWWD